MREGGVGGVSSRGRHFSLDKTNTFSVARRFFEMAPEWLPNRIRIVKQVLLALGRICARHEWAPRFSIDKNSTLGSTGSQTLRTQWFGDTFAIPLDKSSTFRASRFSGITNPPT